MYKAIVTRGNGSSYEVFSADKEALFELVSMVKAAIKTYYGVIEFYNPKGVKIAMMDVDGKWSDI